MNPFEMVIAIVAIVMVARIIMNRQKALAPSEAVVDDAELRRLRDETQKLKERVQVLERVITEDRKSIDLDREIAALRDR